MSERGAVFLRGVGTVSPLGVSIDDVWSRVLAGEVAEHAVPVSERGIPTPGTAATVDRFRHELDALVASRSLRRVSQLSRYCVAAATMARPGEDLEHRDDTAVVLGTCFGSSRYHFDYYEKLFLGGLRDASPLLFSECVMNAASGHVSLHHGLRGASLAIVGGEEVGLSAVVDACERIRAGEVLAAFAGGADEYCDFVHAALASRGFVEDEAKRGASYGEGAALVYLDATSSDGALAAIGAGAIARGGRQRADSAVRQAVRRCLRSAAVDPRDVDLVVTNLRGPGADPSWSDDRLLATIAAELDTGREDSVLVTSPSPLVGEGFAFVSGFEAVVASMAISRGQVPPLRVEGLTIPTGWSAPVEVIETELRHALVLAMTRRGTVATVLLSRARG